MDIFRLMTVTISFLDYVLALGNSHVSSRDEQRWDTGGGVKLEPWPLSEVSKAPVPNRRVFCRGDFDADGNACFPHILFLVRLERRVYVAAWAWLVVVDTTDSGGFLCRFHGG